MSNKEPIVTANGEVPVSDTSELPTETNTAILEEAQLAVNTVSKNDPLYWEDLIAAKNEAVTAVLNQQLLLRELILMSEEIILSDSMLIEQIEGLAKAYDDVAMDIRKTMDKHFVGDVARTGEVSDDEYLEYLQNAGEYITYSETIATLSGTGFLDIFTRIKEHIGAEFNELDKPMADLKDTVETGAQSINELIPEEK